MFLYLENVGCNLTLCLDNSVLSWGYYCYRVQHIVLYHIVGHHIFEYHILTYRIARHHIVLYCILRHRIMRHHIFLYPIVV